MSERRLRLLDRAADARVRLYAEELRVIVRGAKSMGLSSVPVEPLEALLDRMLGRDPEPPQPSDRDNVFSFPRSVW